MLFDDIMMNHEEREIIELCKKLGKSCSFTKNADMSSLCELAYWLYIYDCKEEALKVCEHVNIEIPEKINYNVWDFIIWIWGLEAYIYNSTVPESFLALSRSESGCMNPLSRVALQIAFRSCPCNEPKKDCSVEHGKVEFLT